MLTHDKLNALISVFTSGAATHTTRAQAALKAGETKRYLYHLDLAKAHNEHIEEFRLRIVLLNNSAKKVLQTAG